MNYRSHYWEAHSKSLPCITSPDPREQVTRTGNGTWVSCAVQSAARRQSGWPFCRAFLLLLRGGEMQISLNKTSRVCFKPEKRKATQGHRFSLWGYASHDPLCSCWNFVEHPLSLIYIPHVSKPYPSTLQRALDILWRSTLFPSLAREFTVEWHEAFFPSTSGGWAWYFHQDPNPGTRSKIYTLLPGLEACRTLKENSF